ncbi:MAG: ATP-binding cassette domain-containing protein [Syntrophomonadaceae bacterium]|jgi:ABC-2 type transport system ATP-binding protein
MNSKAIDICKLTKSYEEIIAVHEISMSIPRGSIFGLIGPNGAGKSTLLQTLVGILLPDSGDVRILGKSIREFGPQVRQQVGYVPDIPHLYPFFTVNGMFTLGRKLYKNWDERKCRSLCDYFKIPTRKRVRNLSRGMKVRVALVLALSIRPEVLILDEPTAGLDPVARRAFLKAIIDEAAEEGTTILYSSHNLNDLEQTADHIGVINQGRLLFTSPLDELKNSIHKTQILFSTDNIPAAALKSLPGVIEVTQQGKAYVITASGDRQAFRDALSALAPAIVEPINLSLEDVFITYMKKEGYSYDYAI